MVPNSISYDAQTIGNKTLINNNWLSAIDTINLVKNNNQKLSTTSANANPNNESEILRINSAGF